MDEKTHLLRFGDCELDPVRHELRRNGEPVEIQPRVFDCLRYLVENHERGVGKQELQDRVWTGQVVTDAAMTRAIMKARRAIGDDGDSPRWIRTLHARGYRFIGPVQRIATTATTASPAAAQVPAAATPGPEVDVAADRTSAGSARAAGRERRRQAAVWLLLGVVAMAGLAGLVLWRGAGLLPSAVGDNAVIAVLPVANATGDPDLDWMELGLMGQLGRHLEHGAGRPVVPVRTVLSALEPEGRRAEPTPALLARLLRTTGASHVLAARIERSGQQLQLQYSLHAPEGRVRERILLGGSPTELARGLMHDVDATLSWSGGRNPVAQDDLVTEAYLRGLALQLQGRSSEAEPLFRMAIEAAPASFWPRYELALSIRNQGRAQEAEALLVALDDHGETGTDWLARVALHNALAVTWIEQQRYDEAEVELRGCLRALEGHHDPRRESACLGNLGIVATHQGRLDEAEELLERAGGRLRHLPMGEPGWILHSRGQVADRRGDPASAEALFEQAVAANRLAGNVGHEARSLAALADIRVQQARFAEAREPLVQAAGLFGSTGDRQRQAVRLLDLAEVHLRLGQPGEAGQVLEQCRPIVESLDQETGLAGRIAALEQALGH